MAEHVERLIAFWRAYDWASKALHPDDVNARSIKTIHPAIETSQHYIDAVANGEWVPDLIHPDLPPAPYSGDLRSAKILILMVNPGFSPFDVIVSEKHPQYAAIAKSNVRQDSLANPCFDPDDAVFGGFIYWNRKFRHIISALEITTGSKRSALKLLAEHIVILQLSPYTSGSAPRNGRLKSTDLAKAAAREISQDAGRVVIVARGIKEWGIASASNVYHFPPSTQRSASFGKNSMGYRAVLEALS